jgi:8-oxo-dGTP pyrophosphatase MutT (NUDIX family)
MMLAFAWSRSFEHLRATGNSGLTITLDSRANVRLSADEIREIVAQVRPRLRPKSDWTPSAVLMIFLDEADETRLVLIRRAKDDSPHSGQIGFPGGRVESHDVSTFETALRETLEEIGFDARNLRYLGSMGYFGTMSSGYDAAVHVVWGEGPLSYRPDPSEVAEVIVVPLRAFLEQHQPELNLTSWEDILRMHYHFRPPLVSRPICVWGLTARIIHTFLNTFLGIETRRKDY